MMLFSCLSLCLSLSYPSTVYLRRLEVFNNAWSLSCCRTRGWQLVHCCPCSVLADLLFLLSPCRISTVKLAIPSSMNFQTRRTWSWLILVPTFLTMRNFFTRYFCSFLSVVVAVVSLLILPRYVILTMLGWMALEPLQTFPSSFRKPSSFQNHRQQLHSFHSVAFVFDFISLLPKV